MCEEVGMSEQELRENVIRNLQILRTWCVVNPDYDMGLTKDDCSKAVTWLDDALAMLKAQEPRVMTWEEAQANVNEGPFIIMELRDSTGTEIDYGVLVGDSYEMSEGSLLTVCEFGLLKDDYNKRFRCWTSRPDAKRRAETPWN